MKGKAILLWMIVVLPFIQSDTLLILIKSQGVKKMIFTNSLNL
jgi:hypothetical protein